MNATNKEANRKHLDILERHELVFAALYGSFSKLLPEMAAFWKQLVREERAHADVIRCLAAKMEKDEIRMKALRPSLGGVERAIAEVEKHIQTAATSGITAWKALSMALELEQRMLEKSFFQVFEVDSEEIKTEFEALCGHTAEHVARIEKQLKLLEELQAHAARRMVEDIRPPIARPARRPLKQEKKVLTGAHKQVADAQARIINRLVDAETAVGELYEFYAHAYEDMSEFWLKTAEEENAHARLLKTMLHFIDRGELFHDIGRFDTISIDAFIDRVKREVAATRRKPPSRKHAIATAVAIENSLMDSHFYDIVKSDCPEFQAIAKHLSQDTTGHIEKIRQQSKELQEPFA